MKKTILLALMGILLLSGCTKKEETPADTPQGCDDAPTCGLTHPADMSAYEGFMEEENQFVTLDMADFLTKLEEKQSGIFYFGFSTCPWCIEAVPIMNEAAKEADVHIYYIDKHAESSSEELIQQVEEKLADRLQKNEEGKPTLYVPYVIVLKDGEIIAEHMDTVPGHDAHERKMNEEEQSELKSIYLEMFHKVS